MSLNGNSASLGPKFDGSAPVLIMAQKRKFQRLNMPLFVFVVLALFAQKPSKLGPNGPHNYCLRCLATVCSLFMVLNYDATWWMFWNYFCNIFIMGLNGENFSEAEFSKSKIIGF